MTIQEIVILKQNGDEITLSFSTRGVLKKRVFESVTDTTSNKEIHFLRKNPNRYVDIIGDVIKKEDLENAIAVSGVFRDDDGTIIEQEGLLGSMFYTNTVFKPEDNT